MSFTTGGINNGRLGNQIIRNLAFSFIAKKFNMKVNYYNYELIKKLGICMYIGDTTFDNVIELSDDNYFMIYNSESLNSNLDPNKYYFQSKNIIKLIYDHLHTEEVKQNIINKNPFKNRYNTNNDLFIHIRLGDVEQYTSGLAYYLNTIKLISFDNIYIASDSPNHDIIQSIIKLYPNAKIINYDEINTIQFGSTCKNIILSRGTFSAIIGYLAYFSTIYIPEHVNGKTWYSEDTHLINGWITVNKDMMNKDMMNKDMMNKDMMNKNTMIRFCTFGNIPQYQKSIDLILEEAKNSGYFNTANIFTQKDLPEDYIKFSALESRGFGYWIWKPYIIGQMMKHYPDNDIIIYADAGCGIFTNDNAKNIFNKWISDIMTHNTHRIGFQMHGLPEYEWTKRDLFDYMDCFNIDQIKNSGQYSASIQIYINTKENREFIDEMIRISKIDNYHYMTDDISRTPNASGFREHRHDQSIYSLMLKKHGCVSYASHWDRSEYPISTIRRKFGIADK
jgi:hypothetical protein